MKYKHADCFEGISKRDESLLYLKRKKKKEKGENTRAFSCSWINPLICDLLKF